MTMLGAALLSAAFAFVSLLANARTGAGWSSPVARQAHNLKVTGSNPVPATKHAPVLKGTTDSAALTAAFLLMPCRHQVGTGALRRTTSKGEDQPGKEAPFKPGEP
jgi:hypothetical protein